MRTTFDERPCRSCVISAAGSSLITAAAAAADFSSAVAGFCTRYFAIFFSILMADMSELPVVAFFERVVEIRSGVFFTVVLDLFVALRRDLGAVLEREHVGGVLEVIFLLVHALERLRIEAERGAALQVLLMGVQVDVFEALIFVIRRHVRSF